MQIHIADLYSEVLLSREMEPAFNNYYNVEFRDGFNMPVHSHEFIEIMYARRGSCEVYAGEERYKLEPGDLILLNGGVPHRLFVSSGTPCRVLCLEFDFIDGNGNTPFLRNIFTDIGEVSHFLKGGKPVIKLEDTVEIYPVLNDICRELEHDEPGKHAYIHTAFCQLVIKLARLYAADENTKGKPSDRYIKDAIAYMSNNYHEILSITQIAEHINLNISYFYKIFKRTTGMTPIDFLTGIRMKKAENLLGMSELPVVDIAIIAGFSSRQYFDYVFKRQTGLTPSEYRKSYKIGRKPVSSGL